MEAKEKQKSRELNGCLYLAYRFYYSPIFLLGQLIMGILFLLYLVGLPFIVYEAFDEVPLLLSGRNTVARILEETLAYEHIGYPFYTYRMVFQLENGRTIEVLTDVALSVMSEHREGDFVPVVYDETNPQHVIVGYIKNELKDWVIGLGLVFSISLCTGYFFIGALLVKFFYPKPKIKVNEVA